MNNSILSRIYESYRQFRQEIWRNHEKKSRLVSIYCFFTLRCMDCGNKLNHKPSILGEVCHECFDNWNGMTIEELIS